jgi:hypothetical protein
MLHMLVNTHAETDCAFRGDTEKELLVGAADAFTAPGATEGLEVRGSWVNRAAHEVFLLVDAPNAHVIETAMLNSGLVGRSHTRILPVVDTAVALETS